MKRTQRGFTLLELVAAMAIFALLSVMAYGGLSALLSAKDGLDGSYERLGDWQRAVHRLRLDLGQVRQRPIRDEFGDTQPALYEPEDGRLQFTHGGRRNPLLLARSTLERVAYYVDTDGHLIRLAWLNLDRAQAEEPVKATLLEDIERLEWRYLKSDDEWAEVWPPLELSREAGDAIPLPRAVELQLVSKAFGKLRFLFAVDESA